MANNLAIGLVIGASLSSNFKTAFAGANTTLEKLNQAVAKNQQKHSQFATKLSDLRTKQASLYAEMSRASRLGGTGLALMKKEYDRIGKAIIEVSRQQRDFSQELNKSLKAQQRLSGAMAGYDKAKEKRDNLKGKMIGTVASAAVGVGIMRTYMEQEEAANNLKISMMKANGTFGKFDELSKVATTLGTDLPGTTKDFFNLAQALKKQGISDDVLIGGALKTSAKLNVLLDIKDQYAGGEFLAKFMESHGLKEKDLDQSADYLQRAMFASGLNKEQVYESMKYYAPKVNSLGLTGAKNTEKILAIEGMAGQQGLEGSTFGTGFNMMLSRMNKGPKMMRAAVKGMKAEAQDMVEAVGISFDFWDKKGTFKGIEAMFTEMEKFEKIRAKFGDEGVGLVAEELFGIEGGRLADILAKKGKTGLEEMLTKMREQASLQDRINQKTSTLGAALEALGGAWDNAVGSFGSIFAEEIKNFAKGIQEAIEKYVPLIQKHKEAIKFVGGLVAGFVALRGVLQLGAFGIQTVTMAMNALKIATMTNPIGLLIGAIAVGAYVIYSNWQPIKAFFSDIWDWVVAKFDGAWNWIKSAWSGAGDWVSNAWSGVKDFFSGLWSEVTTAFDGGIIGIGTLILNWSPIGLFYKAFAAVMSWFGIDLPANFSTFASNALNSFTQWVTQWDILGTFHRIFIGVLDWFGIELPTKFGQFGQNIIDGLVNGIRNAWTTAKEIVGELGSGIKGWFAEKLGIHSPSRVFKGYGVNIVEGLALGIDNQKEQATDRAVQLGNALTQAMPTELNAPVLEGDNTRFAHYQPLRSRENSEASGQVVVHFNPTINVNGNAPQGVVQQVQQAIQLGSYEFEQLLKRVLEQQQRVAY